MGRGQEAFRFGRAKLVYSQNAPSVTKPNCGWYNMEFKTAYLLVVLGVLLPMFCSAANEEEQKALAFLKKFNNEAPYEDYKSTVASWNYATNLTKYNQQQRTSASLALSAYYKKNRLEAQAFDKSQLSDDTKRQIEFISSSATPKNESVLKRATELESQMEEIYSTGTVYEPKTKEAFELDPDLYRIMSSSRDYDRLLFAWKGWRDAVGPRLRNLYEEFVKVKNIGARDHGWDDIGAYWRSWYEVDDFEGLVEGFWEKLRPLYQELHAYVRYKLGKAYPNKFAADGPIPAHLFGNMWAQSWVNIYELVEPYQGRPSLDVTKNLKAQNYTALKMVQLAEEFFTSIGLEALPKSFYNNSLIEKPDDRNVVCHASAWDFSINHDVRIKQCTNINHDDLVTTHHELGHIQYYLQYWNQPSVYRSGANPGFHEAVGDTLSLSVDTPQHLKKIGLLDEVSSDKESDINALMKMALRKVAFLPFGFLIDQWRWKVFKGKITPANYNEEWWKLRTKYQGIKPPVERTESDFDPGAKYHIPANTPYIRYFMSFVLQFQFHKAACVLAGHTGPLHTCSIYQSAEAGKRIGEMLMMGKSKPWPKALAKLTGTETLDVQALEDYFRPLYIWLKEQRQTLKYPAPGWESNPSSTQDPSASATFVTISVFAYLITFVLSSVHLFF